MSNGDKVHEVVFARTGLTVDWDPAAENLLELALRHGLDPPHSCREGGCLSCLTAVASGRVEYVRDMLLEPPSGEALLCVCRPASRVVIDA